jgi:Ca2+:H+ antiporter
MNLLFGEILRNRLLWLLAFVPVMFITQKLKPEAHTLLFALSVLGMLDKTRSPPEGANC